MYTLEDCGSPTPVGMVSDIRHSTLDTGVLPWRLLRYLFFLFQCFVPDVRCCAANCISQFAVAWQTAAASLWKVGFFTCTVICMSKCLLHVTLTSERMDVPAKLGTVPCTASWISLMVGSSCHLCGLCMSTISSQHSGYSRKHVTLVAHRVSCRCTESTEAIPYHANVQRLNKFFRDVKTVFDML